MAEFCEEFGGNSSYRTCSKSWFIQLYIQNKPTLYVLTLFSKWQMSILTIVVISHWQSQKHYFCILNVLHIGQLLAPKLSISCILCKCKDVGCLWLIEKQKTIIRRMLYYFINQSIDSLVDCSTSQFSWLKDCWIDWKSDCWLE